jgi:hypothetical protein
VKTESKPVAKKVKVEEKASAAAVDDEDIPLVRLGEKEGGGGRGENATATV